ncbi:MAG: hypothetical protein JWQ98_2376 [Chlorobi bacterium]|nr:hypothetical protein [Chlorobiota bacterium]
MASQKLLWTALPHGVDGDKLKLSIYISPRLTPGGPKRLDEFPDFWNAAKGHWPGKLNSLDFFVEIDSNPLPIPVERVKKNPDTSDPYCDPEMWKHIFKASTPVKPYNYPDYKNRQIRSYPARGVLSFLRETYATIGEGSPNSHPNVDTDTTLHTIRDTFGFINHRPEVNVAVAVKLPPNPDPFLKRTKVLDARKYADYGFTSLQQFSFQQAARFYDRPENTTSYLEKPNVALVPHRIAVPDIDFHQMVASLSDYPELERRLGIVIEVLLPKPPMAFNRIRVKFKAGGQGFSDANAIRPWTVVTTDGSFRPLPRAGSDLRDGMLKLEGANDRHDPQTKSPFDVVQIDVDGSAMKAVDFAGNLYRLVDPRSRAYTSPNEAALPALRSGGIGVLKFNRAVFLAQLFQDFSKRNVAADAAGAVDDFYADDLLRGYRVDVLDDKWRSLCRRDGVYTMTADGVKEIKINDEEGYVKGASTSSKDGGSSDLYLHEMLFRWKGWSLVAKRPGKTIAPDTYKSDGSPKAAQAENVTDDPSGGTLPPGVNLKTSFKATPGTLPMLRFGRIYRFRARAVDLVGNSEPLSSTDESQATDKILYSRFEPVPPPAVVLRWLKFEGESVEHVVIRSNYDKNTAAYASSLNTLTGLEYDKQSSRHIVPPKTSQLMAETHSMFDEDIKSGPSGIARAYNVSKKEMGTLFDREIIDIDTGSPTPVPNPTAIILVTPPDVKAHPPYPILKGDMEASKPEWAPHPENYYIDPLNADAPAAAAGQYLIHREDRVALPYLPDPFSRGVSLRGLPNSGSSEKFGTVKIPFTGVWPLKESFILRVSEIIDDPDYCDAKPHAGVTKWDPGARVLNVYLGKGEKVTVQYSSYLDIGDVKQMGLAQWLKGALKFGDLMKDAVTGLHWMMTPYRTMTLVHAVQQPLCKPTIKKLEGIKNLIGDTYVDLKGLFQLSVRSTGKIDLFAAWDEPMDYLTEPVPRDGQHEASHPGQYQIIKGSAHVFESKIEEFYPDLLPIPIAYPATGDPADKEWIKLDQKDFRHEFGDTKHRMVRYHILGTTRFREYFPTLITDDPLNLTREGDEFTVNIRSSARPDAPKVLYVIPTFGWDPPQKIGNDIVSRRCGGGLRVYMDRPWYSTGEGEMLGVVLRGGGSVFETASDVKSDLMKPYVTQWGMDPVWGSDYTKPSPSASDFPISTNPDNGEVSGLSLDELRNGAGKPYPVVSVAPHVVEFDEERQLWFCDIVVDAGQSYYPFVRLALARYQPNSITDAHLSRVVMTDFAQLAPDRVAAVTFDSDKAIRVMVSGVHGINQFSKAEGFNPSDKKTYKNVGYSRRVSVTVEAPVPGIDYDVVGEMGWAPVSKELTDIELAPFQQYESKMVWMAQVNLPEKPKGLGGKPYRLTIREYERLYADADVATVSLANEREATMLKDGKTDKDGMAVYTTKDSIERLVYADTILL